MLNIKRLKYIVHAHEKKIQHSKLSVVFIIKCFLNNYKCILHCPLNIYKCNVKFPISICFINKLVSTYTRIGIHVLAVMMVLK